MLFYVQLIAEIRENKFDVFLRFSPILAIGGLAKVAKIPIIGPFLVELLGTFSPCSRYAICIELEPSVSLVHSFEENQRKFVLGQRQPILRLVYVTQFCIEEGVTIYCVGNELK